MTTTKIHCCFGTLAVCLFTSVGLSGPPDALLTPAQLADGWISLFDGQSLYGWRRASRADWKVEQGAIVVASGQPGLLRTTTQFSDYALRLQFRCGPKAQSGLFLRTSPQPKDPAKDCYQLNIAGRDAPLPIGSLVGRKRAGESPREDGWQTLEVTAEKGHFTVKCNGQAVVDWLDPQPLGRGFIGLQYDEGKVEFRNIWLRPLGLQPLLNGKNLDGWLTRQANHSTFHVSPEGHLDVDNGPGQLETAGTYGDFVLQLEAITRGKHLNSGVFFRCIPGDIMMGYECQIHHGYQDGDRSKPIDCGTGGIFRRKNARWVLTDDFQWFPMTIVAEGPHMATWVNGCQVCDWTDQRKRNDNPRRGLRLQPGTIMIQGHDPTTSLSFSNLRIDEMAKRWN